MYFKENLEKSKRLVMNQSDDIIMSILITYILESPSKHTLVHNHRKISF